MSYRALIIAIEEYPNSQGNVATKLPGTLQAGLDFKAWLEDKWKREGRTKEETEIVFCSSPQQTGHLGADSTTILKAIDDLKIRGRGTTEELYVFFSGHGYSFVGSGTRADVIMTSDFITGKLPAGARLN